MIGSVSFVFSRERRMFRSSDGVLIRAHVYLCTVANLFHSAQCHCWHRNQDPGTRPDLNEAEMKKQTAGVLLRTGDAISGTSAAVLLGNQASVYTEKDLLLEWLAAKEYVRQVEHALFEANQKEANLRVAVHDLVLQKAL